MTLQEFLNKIKVDFRLTKPSVDSSDKGTLYIPHPPSLEQAHHFKLELTFRELAQQGHISGKKKEQLEIMDQAIPSVLYLDLVYDEDMQAN